MASITRTELFCWEDVESLGDLDALELVLRHLPDEPLMRELEKERGKGRNDYPVRAVWNSILAGRVYQHSSVESLRRELRRNAQLREVCGFDIYGGADVVPPSSTYSRFSAKLEEHQEDTREIYETLIDMCVELLPDFGRKSGCDGKAIESFAGGPAKCEYGDKRGDHDGRWGIHTHRSTRSDGTVQVRKTRWFGYKIHLIADTTYELPIAYEVLPANRSEMPVMRTMLASLAKRRKQVLDRCEVFTADRGYDDGKLVKALWDEYGIKPVIGIRNCWQDVDKTRLVPGTQNVTYDWEGTVRCTCPAMLKEREMAFGGFEKDRGTLKYRCPARHYGYECAGQDRCPIRSSIRIPLSVDRRIFTPVARSSYAWRGKYASRTAVERINSRIDTSFGFEHHTVRGLAKMRTMVNISMAIMLALAIGRVKENRPDLMRSLVGSAA